MRETGIVRKWEKGWGFIRRQGHPDLFVHHSEIKVSPKILREGQAVSFIVKQTERGLCAGEVRPLVADANEENWSDFIECRRFPKKDFD